MIPGAKEVMNLLGDAAGNILQGVHKLLKLDMTLDEVANIYSQKLDEIIVNDVAKEGYQYESGRFSLKYLDDSKFEALYELWFTKEGKWYKRDNHSAPIETKYLATDALDSLRREQFVSFEIASPEQKKIDSAKADTPLLADNLKRV